MKFYAVLTLAISTFSFALEQKDDLSASELYEEADAIVIIKFSSGKFKSGIGDSYEICGDVKKILKGDVEKEICIHDGDDYGNECFNRSLSHHYMAFVRKAKIGHYVSLWANDSVFEVEKGIKDWEPVECKIRRSYSVEIGKQHFTDVPYFERIGHIFEYAFNKQIESPLLIND